jgi:hypothetical protein
MNSYLVVNSAATLCPVLNQIIYLTSFNLYWISSNVGTTIIVNLQENKLNLRVKKFTQLLPLPKQLAFCIYWTFRLGICANVGLLLSNASNWSENFPIFASLMIGKALPRSLCKHVTVAKTTGKQCFIFSQVS